jgi:hypothetical protein
VMLVLRFPLDEQNASALKRSLGISDHAALILDFSFVLRWYVGMGNSHILPGIWIPRNSRRYLHRRENDKTFL